ncbi:MAG: adenosylcobinamide-GDP ribazoletransferase [Acidimicrobiales bacterium]
MVIQLRRAIAFLTPFSAGLGGNGVPTPGCLAWFPAVGTLLGLGLGGLWWLAGRVWQAPVAAAVVVAADLAATGLLHVDGLADSADGLLPHMSLARRLEVMASPEIGAFGVAVVATTLLLRWAALASLRPAPLLLGALWCMSRTGMAAAVRSRPYARASLGGGLASAFGAPAASAAGVRRAAWAPLIAGVAASLGLAAGWRPAAGPVAVAVAALAGVGVVVLAERRLGGFTGDVLGAAGVLAETAGVLAAAVRW